MEKRKTSIELMRFFAVVMMVLIHIRQILYPDNGMAELAFVAVEFFFMVSNLLFLLSFELHHSFLHFPLQDLPEQEKQCLQRP